MAATDPANLHVGESTLGEYRIVPEIALIVILKKTFQPRQHSSKKVEKTLCSFASLAESKLKVARKESPFGAMEGE